MSALEQITRERDRLQANANRSLRQLIRDAELTLEDLEAGRVSTTVGGSVLSHQLYMDAERYVTQYKLAADMAVWVAEAEAQTVSATMNVLAGEYGVPDLEDIDSKEIVRHISEL